MWERFRKWLSSPVFPDEEKTRVARLLNTILLIVLILVTGFTVFALVVTPNLERVVVELFILVVAVGMLFLMRRGYVKLTGFILTTVIWIAVSYGTYLAGGFRGSNMASYLGIVFIAGLLLGPWSAFLFGLLSIGFTGWLLYVEVQHLLPPPADYVTLTTFWWEFSMVVLGVIGLLTLTMNSLSGALRRAHNNEQELIETINEIRKMARELQEANEFKTHLIARVSHELRTPLSAIVGLTELLHFGGEQPLTREQRAITERILSNSEYLETTFAELLEQSQIELGKLEISKVKFSPADVLEKAVGLSVDRARAKGLSLHTNITSALPVRLIGDPRRIGQVIDNLVENAIKFTEEGSILVTMDRLDDTSWVITCSDTGIGIPLDQLALVFDPFRQVDESYTREYGGVGLGLSIVKQLVHAMNGKVDVNSELGKGSVFIVTLPLMVPEAQTRTEETK